MPATPAFLIYSLITLSGFPAQAWYAIDYPTRAICEAQAAALKAAHRSPEKLAQFQRDGITVKIEPQCSSQPPQFWIVDGDNR